MPVGIKAAIGYISVGSDHLDIFRGKIFLNRSAGPESKIFQLPVFFTYAKRPSRNRQTMEIAIPSQSSLDVLWIGQEWLNRKFSAVQFYQSKLRFGKISSFHRVTAALPVFVSASISGHGRSHRRH